MQRYFALFAMLFVSFASYADDSICARVKIEIKQELSLERQGFDAAMSIINGLDTLSLENVGVTVKFTDEAGAPVIATSESRYMEKIGYLYTFVVEYRGGSYVSQVRATTPQLAMRKWAKYLDEDKVWGLGKKSKETLVDIVKLKRPTPLDGVTNTWFAHCDLGRYSAMMNIIKTVAK